MHRGGGLGEGTDDLGPRRARRGKHRREAEAAETRQAQGSQGEPERNDPSSRMDGMDYTDRGADQLRAGSGNGGRVGVTYKYFGAPDGATAARCRRAIRTPPNVCQNMPQRARHARR